MSAPIHDRDKDDARRMSSKGAEAARQAYRHERDPAEAHRFAVEAVDYFRVADKILRGVLTGGYDEGEAPSNPAGGAKSPAPCMDDEVTLVEGASADEGEALNAYTSTTEDGRRATLVVGVQSFEVGPEYDTAGEVDWLRWQLAKALIQFRGQVQPDVDEPDGAK